MSTKQSCLVCPRKEVTRGLCAWCYRTAQSLIYNGDETWESLIKMGMARGVIRKQNPFKEKYINLKHENIKHLHN